MFCCFKREKFTFQNAIRPISQLEGLFFWGEIKRKKPLGLIEVMYVSDPLETFVTGWPNIAV